VNCLIDVLIVEDSENDALLLLEELKQKSYVPVFQRVETPDDFLAALKSRVWDAVICDYLLPEFSGPEALKLFKKEGLDMPFIVVSGVFGEDKAVDMMKAGASDYILKGNLSRLVPALEREMEAAQERRLRKRAEGAMQYLAAIVESSEDAIYGKDLDSMIASWNPAAERLFGYSAEEIIGHSTVALFPLNRRDELLDILASIRRGETVSIPDTERLHKNGQPIAVSITISPIMNLRGEIIGASSIARDIRKQKQAEHEQLQLSRRLSVATHQVQALSGMLPICASCKRIRDDKGYWEQVETYLYKRSEIIFSHSLCPVCAHEYEREFDFEGKQAPPLDGASG
jgi:two-component system cell cycle sensor histidine kinase/response regulator CckA